MINVNDYNVLLNPQGMSGNNFKCGIDWNVLYFSLLAVLFIIYKLSFSKFKVKQTWSYP